MDGVQLSQGYRATMRRQFTFYHSISRSSFKPPNGFEPRSPGLEIQHLSQQDIAPLILLFYYIVLKRVGIGNLLSSNSACTATAVHVPLHWPQMLNAFWLFSFFFFVSLLIINPNSSNQFLKILKDTINYNCYFKKNNKNKCSKSFEKD